MSTTLIRDSYGVIAPDNRRCYDYATGQYTGGSSEADRALYAAAAALVERAAQAGKLPTAYDNMEWGRSGKARGKRIGDARRHEIYDIGQGAGTVLVCVRSTEGTRYGQKTTDKTYYLVARHGRGLRVTEANKAVAAKAAKAAGDQLGIAIAVCQGKRPAPAPKCMAPRSGYKIVRREGERFVSVWDDSEWAIGKTRTEAATEDHSGGYYYYATLEEALAQAVERQAFGDARQYHNLSIVEVVSTGREVAHPTEGAVKRCATRIKPVREVCVVL